MEKSEVFSCLQKEFKKQKQKIVSLLLKAIDKSVKLNNQDSQNKEKITNIISKYQDRMQVYFKKINMIFEDTMGILKNAKKLELELKRRVKEAEEQNQFWEKTNEDLEIKLNEANFQKSEFEQKYQKAVQNESKKDLEIQKRQNLIFSKESEILAKNEKISLLLNQISNNKEKVKMMEDETRMVKEKQKETAKDLKSFERKTHLNMQKTDLQIVQLEVENEELRRKLQTKEEEKQELKSEIKEMQWKLDNKELHLKAALSKNGIGDNESVFNPSVCSLKNKSEFLGEFSKKEAQISSDGRSGGRFCNF